LLSPRPDRDGLRARQPTSQITPRGQRVGVWAQPSGALRGGAPVTLGGKIESASAGPGERTGDRLAEAHRLYDRLSNVAAPCRAAASAPSAGRLPAAERCHSRGGSSIERRAPSAERRAPSTEHRAPSSEHRATSTERRAASHDHRGRRAAAKLPGHATRSAGRGLGAAQRVSSGQSPGNPGREDRVSVGRTGGASRRWALRCDWAQLPDEVGPSLRQPFVLPP
jgi:hypothetical protein